MKRLKRHDISRSVCLAGDTINENTLLRALIDAVPDLIFFKDCNSVYLGYNKAFQQIPGRSEQAIIGKTDFDFFDRQSAERFQSVDREVFNSGESRKSEDWVSYADGRKILWNTVKTPVYSNNGKLLGLVGISRDITERNCVEEILAESDARIRSLGNNLPNGYFFQFVLYKKKINCFQFISAGVENVHGINNDAILSDPMTLLGLIDPAQLSRFEHSWKTSADKLSDFKMELLTHNPDGRDCWVHISARPKRNNDAIIWDGVAIDITEKKLSDEQIWRQANFDPLTNLPNRRLFQERLVQEMRKVQRNQRSLALFFIDIDHFKEINDTLGHDHGDGLLQLAANRLLACVRETDTVSRLGGDEFNVILSELENTEIADRIAQSILSSMAEPFLLNGEQSFVSASIGITLFPDDASESTELIKNADQAMYAAKDRGRNCYSYFTKTMQEAAQFRLNMLHELLDAVALQQFRLVYQPIVELATGQIKKAEALIRWHHPQKGIISPTLFIPIAEANGVIHDIGDWVFKEAAQQAKRFSEKYNPDFQISINKSPVQFRRTGHTALNWLTYLEEQNLDGASLAVEITEGLLLDASKATSDKLLAFRDAGIKVSLDDFGTGYSSLSYIQKFDIDYMKIDRSFVCNLTAGSTDMALCEAIILMAHKLGIQVIAEGIETMEQKELLQSAGCDFGQGFLFSKPLTCDAFENLLDLKLIVPDFPQLFLEAV